MAKRKRKVSSSQRDKEAIHIAKILKRKGILQKSTKLHGGKYISKSVLKKTQELRQAARPHFTGTKAISKQQLAEAKAEGYLVNNGRIITPRDHEFIKRIKRGELAGIKPVKGGAKSEVKLPFDARNYHELLELLRNTDLDSLKLPQERFAFQVQHTWNGNENSGVQGMSYQTFGNGREIARWLEHYKPEVFVSGLKFFRLHPEDTRELIPGPSRRPKIRRSRDRREEGQSAYSLRMARLDRVNPAKAEKIRKAQAEKAKARYLKQKMDPAWVKKKREASLANKRRKGK